MQQESRRRTNVERSEAMRATLLAVGRKLFTEKGYGATGTPELVEAAGVTRGALYHHFADKQALFQAVVEQEAKAVAAEIENSSGPAQADSRAALLAGTDAYFAAMRVPGRTRLLLLDGPAVLGRTILDEIDSRHGNRTLREALQAMMDAGEMKSLPPDAITGLLAAAYDRAALDIDAGASAGEYRETLIALIDGLMKPVPSM